MAWNWDRDYREDSYSQAPAGDTGTGMDDFLASARKLTDQFLEQSRLQAEKILKEANAQAEQIAADARQKADELLHDAENHAEEIGLQARREADAILEQAHSDADAILEQAHADADAMRSKKGSIDQEYAVQCVSDCFEEIRRRQEETLDVLNAQWQKFLIGLMPSDEDLPAPEPASAPEPEPPVAEAEDAPAPQPELPYDLEEKVNALSREMDELFWNRKK